MHHADFRFQAAEEKEQVDVQMYKDAFDKILKIVGVASGDSSLEKIVADFVKVEDQNFALFNYVTEMNNQARTCQSTTFKVQYSTVTCNRGIEH